MQELGYEGLRIRKMDQNWRFLNSRYTGLNLKTWSRLLQIGLEKPRKTSLRKNLE